MAQWVKELQQKPENLSLIPKTYSRMRERTNSQKFSGINTDGGKGSHPQTKIVSKTEPEIMVHTFNLSTWGAETSG